MAPHHEGDEADESGLPQDKHRGEHDSHEMLRDVHRLQITVEVMKVKLTRMEEALDELITRPEFTPVKLLAYGLVGSLLAGLIAAILSQVIKR